MMVANQVVLEQTEAYSSFTSINQYQPVWNRVSQTTWVCIEDEWKIYMTIDPLSLKLMKLVIVYGQTDSIWYPDSFCIYQSAVKR